MVSDNPSGEPFRDHARISMDNHPVAEERTCLIEKFSLLLVTKYISALILRDASIFRREQEIDVRYHRKIAPSTCCFFKTGMPELAKQAGAAVVGTGRSDFPNQINNVLAFPGIFKGALDANAKQITLKMKIAAAEALAHHVENPTAEMIVPSPLDREVAIAVAHAVKKAA